MNWDATVDTRIEVVDSVTLQGYRMSTGWAADQRVYFYTKLSRPFDSIVMDTAAVIRDGKRTGTSYIARLDYKMKDGEKLMVRTALSGTGVEGAKLNFEAEAEGTDFNKYVADARAMWNRELSKIEITTNDIDAKTNFYTALYHTMTAPTISSDVDGSYWGMDKKVHKADNVTYGTFSLWDTYRTEHPLLTYMHPARVNDMVKSFLNHYDQFGRLPVWNFYGNETDMMIGYHSVPVIVEAYLKGIGNFDAEHALLQTLTAIATLVSTRRTDMYRLTPILLSGRDGRFQRLWSMLMTIGASLSLQRNLENRILPKSSTSVRRTIATYIILQQHLCSLRTRKVSLSLRSIRTNIPRIYAKAMHGIISGMSSMMLTD